MSVVYEIGGHRFQATSLIDATVYAIEKARELMMVGDQQAARRLYIESWRVRDEIQYAVRHHQPLPDHRSDLTQTGGLLEFSRAVGALV